MRRAAAPAARRTEGRAARGALLVRLRLRGRIRVRVRVRIRVRVRVRVRVRARRAVEAPGVGQVGRWVGG